MVTAVTGNHFVQLLPLVQQIRTMKGKVAKLMVVCVICLAIAYFLVWLGEIIIN
jgi:hypothetical protein